MLWQLVSFDVHLCNDSQKLHNSYNIMTAKYGKLLVTGLIATIIFFPDNTTLATYCTHKLRAVGSQKDILAAVKTMTSQTEEEKVEA